MRETPRLSRSSINCHTHIDDISDLAEQLIEFAVGHVEGHVADEEGAGGFGGGAAEAVAVGGGTAAGGGVLDGEAAAFEGLLVHVADGAGGGVVVGEVDVAESVMGGVSFVRG